MAEFWDALIFKVKRGEMDMEEAHRRDNYYQFARCSPGVRDAWDYVMSTPYEELPPVCFSLAGDEFSESEFRLYLSLVQEGKITAYEAAQAYFDKVMQ